MTPIRRRLDADLVRRGLATTREHAAELVASGRVTVGGAPALNPLRQVRADEPVRILEERPQFVTRAGDKLAAALDLFAIPVDGARALDAGAAVGGFTDCLLQRGAREVVAVDVGYGQFSEPLRADGRVEVHERTNVRLLQSGDLGSEPFDLVVADLSFISLRAVLPNLLGQAKAGGDLILLVKPQFEATRAEASRGKGVISDPSVWRRVLADVAGDLRGHDADVVDGMVSPLRGMEGNVEFFLHAVAARGRGAGGVMGDLDIDHLVELAAAVGS